MHDAYTIGIPVLVIIFGILLNRSDVKELRAEIGAMRTDLDAKITTENSRLRAEISSVRTDLDAKITAESGNLRSEIASLRTDIASLRSEFHQEFREFYRTLGQHDVRIENLEKRQAS